MFWRECPRSPLPPVRGSLRYMWGIWGKTQWAHAYAHRSEPKARKTPQRDRQVASSITHIPTEKSTYRRSDTNRQGAWVPPCQLVVAQ